MCQFIETLKIKNHTILHVEWHNQRLNKTREQFFENVTEVDLSQIIEIPVQETTQIMKCRVLYNQNIHRIEYIPYQSKGINQVFLWENPKVDYSFKFLNRNQLIPKNQNYSKTDFLITQNQKICDFTYSNIVFFDGENWITPKSYLLNGTCRQRLLFEGKIQEKEILIEDIRKFQSFKRINAMLGFENSPVETIDLIKSLPKKPINLD